MNYKKLHDRIIARSRKENRANSELYTIHHILPKCMGGQDVPENRVLLTPKEHYVIHRLLARKYSKFPEVKYLVDSFANGMKGPDSPKLSTLNYYINILRSIATINGNAKVDKRRTELNNILRDEAVRLMDIPAFNRAAVVDKMMFKP